MMSKENLGFLFFCKFLGSKPQENAMKRLEKIVKSVENS